MNLITFLFDMDAEDQSEFVQAIEELKESWRSQGLTISLFRDTTRADRFLQIFLTEKTVDELTEMIQQDTHARVVFEKIRDSQSRVVVACMEQIL